MTRINRRSPIISAMTGLIFILLIASVTEADTMKSIYSLNRAVMPVLEPKIYNIKKVEMRGLMQIPIDNAVATNKMPNTNAVILIEFKDEKVKYKTVAKDFKNYVGGGDIVYVPIFSEDTIGYSQTRGFNLLNINTKKNQYYSIIGDTNYQIDQIAVVNAEKRLFLFGIKVFGSANPLKVLRLMDLSTSQGKVVAEKLIDGLYSWVYGDSTIFFWHRVNHNLIAMNLKFEDCDHPLVHFIGLNKDKFNGLSLVAVHPALPFAIIQENIGAEASVIAWDRETNKCELYKIFNNTLNGATGGHQFSNDGKWVYFRHSIDSKNRSYILMPVDPKLHHYLGKPILLGEVPDYPDKVTAMTRNPAGLVASGCKEYGKSYYLKKWDFTQAIPLIENGK